MSTPAIRTENVSRVYTLSRRQQKPGPDGKPVRQFTALDGVSIEVRPGELFGLLGPNGAGKTTLIKILTTLLAPSGGRAWVNGLDVTTQMRELRPLINVVSGGESCGYGILTVRENLWLFSQIYGVTRAEAKRRIDFMLDVVGLADKADTKVSHLSTGQRQKMNFCRGFITEPTILFLDEPTLGLDVTAARTIRKFVREWLAQQAGRTLLLTTHYMAEADELCDRLAIIDGGKVLRCDTPANLKREVQQHPMYTLAVTPGQGGAAGGPADLVKKLEHTPGVRQVTTAETPNVLELKLSLDEEPAIGAAVQAVVQAGARIQNLAKVEPTLEDVFIELVGRGLGDDAAKDEVRA